MDFSRGSEVLWMNYDGPNYLVVEKTWYNPKEIARNFSNPIPIEYYPAHWPLYPLIIRLFDSYLLGPTAMLVATIIGSLVLSLAIFFYSREVGIDQNSALILVSVGLFLPARMVILRSIGSPEPWFAAFCLLCLYFYRRQMYWPAGLMAALAQATKAPGVLLLLAVVVFEGAGYLCGKRESIGKILGRILPFGLVGVVIGIVFGIYYIRTGDLMAYFHSGDNFHLFLPPFQIFTKVSAWVGDFWLEEVIWMWGIYLVGVLGLFKQKLNLEGIFALTFVVVTFFVAHRDISRYIIPVSPLILIGYQKAVLKKEVLAILLLMIVPIVLYSWNFVLHNNAPVADWTPYL